MIRRLSTVVVALMVSLCAVQSFAQETKVQLSGDALATPDFYLFMDVPATWKLLVDPIEMLAAQPAIKGDPTLGPQIDMLVTTLSTEISRPLAAFGLDPIHDIKTVSMSVVLTSSGMQALFVIRGDFSKCRLGELLKSPNERTELVNGKELHFSEGIPISSGSFEPAYYLTATEWVLGDSTTVRAAAAAKNFQNGKVQGPTVAGMVAKPALVMGGNQASVRNSWVGQMLSADATVKTMVEMFDEVSWSISGKEFKLTFKTPNQKIASAALDLANGLNEWMKMLPSLMKGAGHVLLGVGTLVPEEIPEEVQGLIRDRKSFLQLMEALAGLVKANGTASVKGDRFDWRIQGSVGSAAMLAVIGGVAAWLSLEKSAPQPEPYIERQGGFDNPENIMGTPVDEPQVPDVGDEPAQPDGEQAE